MKTNFRTILIIFLVAILGGAIGTYGILEINKNQNDLSDNYNSINTVNVIEQVHYIDETKGNYVDAIDKSINCVVEITTSAKVTTYNFFGTRSTSDVTYLGSGVIISDNGYIVTNNHVVKDATNIIVKLQDGNNYEAKIIGADEKTDLALIKISANNLPYASLADSDQLKIGEEVIAIGNGLGKGTTASNGIVSALNREVTIDKYSMTLILTNAEINSGNSGGGLFDLNGNLIGIVNAKSSSSIFSSEASIEGIGYAIPSNLVKTIVSDLLNYGYVKQRATLGVMIYNQGYSDISGAVVSEVLEGGSGQKAGLKANDIIKAIDDYEVTDFTSLAKALEYYNVGDKVILTVERDNEIIKLTCILQDASID